VPETRSTTRRSVVVVIPGAGGRYAAIRSAKHGGAIELPGGKVDPGESDVEAARRETWEEVGHALALHAKPLRHLCVIEHSYAGVQWSTVVFVGAWSGALLRSSAEGEATWVTREELLAGTYGEVVRRIFEALDAHEAEAVGHVA
jgi:8-oxo-dGTP diphosphatase